MKPHVTKKLVCTGKGDDGRMQYVERTEWTPFVATNTPLPSAWKDARGKPLTDRQITQYKRDGRYGPEAQLKALAEDKARTLAARQKRLRRIERDKERADEARFASLMEAKYV